MSSTIQIVLLKGHCNLFFFFYSSAHTENVSVRRWVELTCTKADMQNLPGTSVLAWLNRHWRTDWNPHTDDFSHLWTWIIFYEKIINAHTFSVPCKTHARNKTVRLNLAPGCGKAAMFLLEGIDSLEAQMKLPWSIKLGKVCHHELWLTHGGRKRFLQTMIKDSA